MSANDAMIKKKRRKKKKKQPAQGKEQVDIEQAMQVGSASSSVNLLVSKLQSLGKYSLSDIEQALEQMFERGLSYDNYDAVCKYLDQMQTQQQPTTASHENTPVNNTQVVDELSAEECKPEATEENTNHNKSNGTVANGIKENEDKTVPPLPQATTPSELIENLLSEVDDLDAVLDGLVIWLPSADAATKQQFVSSKSLDALLERVVEYSVTKSDLSEAALNSLDRRICEVLRSLLGLSKDSLAYSSLENGIKSYKQVIVFARELAASTKEEATSRKISPKEIAQLSSVAIRNACAKVPSVSVGVNGSSLSAYASQADLLDKQVRTSIPRGDALLLNTSRNLTAGDVKRLFRLRDSSCNAVACATKCCEMSGRKEEETIDVQESETEKDEVVALLSEVESEAVTVKTEAEELQRALDAAFKAQPGSVGPLQEKKQTLLAEAAELNKEREALLEKLAAVDSSIKSKQEEIDKCNVQITESNDQHATDQASLQQQKASLAGKKRIVDMKRVIAGELGNFSRFVERAGLRLGPSGEKEKHIGEVKNSVEHWRLRTILAIDRYLGVEVHCIQFIQNRIAKAEKDIAKVEEQRSKAMAMPTLLERSDLMLKKLKTEIAEDAATLQHLQTEAKNRIADANSNAEAVDKQVPQIIEALRRITTNASRIGLAEAIPLPVTQTTTQNGAPAADVKDVVQTKTTGGSWGGWGSNNSAKTSKKSLLEIQKEEEELQNVATPSVTAEKPETKAVVSEPAAKEEIAHGTTEQVDSAVEETTEAVDSDVVAQIDSAVDESSTGEVVAEANEPTVEEESASDNAVDEVTVEPADTKEDSDVSESKGEEVQDEETSALEKEDKDTPVFKEEKKPDNSSDANEPVAKELVESATLSTNALQHDLVHEVLSTPENVGKLAVSEATAIET